jgi:energy-coupling factor transporter transmembrane protein EcfT
MAFSVPPTPNTNTFFFVTFMALLFFKYRFFPLAVTYSFVTFLFRYVVYICLGKSGTVEGSHNSNWPKKDN